MVVKFEGLPEGTTIKVGDVVIVGIGKEEKKVEIINKEAV